MTRTRTSGKTLYTIIIFLILISFFFASATFAQPSDISIVSTYTFTDEEVENGDIISFDLEQNSYYRSGVPNDKRLFGVVDKRPIVVFRTKIDAIPVAQSGRVLVNVTTLNGSIKVGDHITSSSILGKGQKFDQEEGYVIGIALEPLNETTSTSTAVIEGKEIIVGKILAELTIIEISPTGRVTSVFPVNLIENTRQESGVVIAFRYIAAAVFAIGSLFLIFRNFGPNLTQGIVSVGRNPLAKTTIQAMVAFNVILILVISVTSLLVSLIILFLPL